jgi:hypothetical protein
MLDPTKLEECVLERIDTRLVDVTSSVSGFAAPHVNEALIKMLDCWNAHDIEGHPPRRKLSKVRLNKQQSCAGRTPNGSTRVTRRLKPLRHSWLNTGPFGKRTTKYICRSGRLIVSGKQISQYGAGFVRNSCVSSAPT